MRVLVGCATSCVALRAFLDRGHDAWQCDILPADEPTNRHIQDDIRNVLDWGWDLLIVSNPPCTRLCNSGVRWLKTPPPGRTHDEMWAELDAGAALFSDCLNAPIPRVAVENPVMHGHARERVRNWIKPQIVQPWWFGDPFFKATGLYRRGLPPLHPTDRLTPPEPGTSEHKSWSMVHRAPPGADRWKIRSKTFPGMAAAWADQWGGQIDEVAA
ncbi:hypothetical protein SAMN04490244_101285 [Tranquillimonas rosea]|uniref:DNA cytosine methyltransferase n=1 Tax=Tranquillimonas rosea TaxID=641238 RepID=A0A1H9PQ66_9RHOB|nr:hypothetical protein [Tranquillimonas rosea]SER50344.1 hypothetical protein SAMN04490244_101285 [Tranquillimonas rosea]